MLTARGFTAGSFCKAGMIQGDKIKIKKTVVRRVPFKVSDEIILDMRSLSEFEGWKPRRIAEKYAHLNLSYAYLIQVLHYYTRSSLIPQRKAA